MNAKTVLITGVSSGIGKACLLQLLEAGYQVAGCGRRLAVLRSLQLELEKSYPGKVFLQACDVSQEKDVQRFAEASLKRFKSLDAVVNNAGIGYYEECDAMDAAQFRRLLEVNLLGPALVVKHTVKHMKKRRRGQLLFISSVWGLRSSTRKSMYSASKFGIRGYAEGLREELMRYNIKVSTVFPGLVNTAWQKKLSAKEKQRRRSVSQGKSSILEADDVAALVVTMLSQSGRANIEHVDLIPFLKA